MNSNQTRFIREVILSNEVPLYLKEDGLTIMLSAHTEEANAAKQNIPDVELGIVTNFDTVRMNNAWLRFSINNDTWRQIQAEVDGNHKIPSIKIFRMATNLGFKDSKNAVENDVYFRQPSY